MDFHVVSLKMMGILLTIVFEFVCLFIYQRTSQHYYLKVSDKFLNGQINETLRMYVSCINYKVQA
jgi:hypothetical protein